MKKIMFIFAVVLTTVFASSKCYANCWDIIVDGDISTVCVEEHVYPLTPWEIEKNEQDRIDADNFSNWFNNVPETSVPKYRYGIEL